MEEEQSRKIRTRVRKFALYENSHCAKIHTSANFRTGAKFRTSANFRTVRNSRVRNPLSPPFVDFFIFFSPFFSTFTLFV